MSKPTIFFDLETTGTNTVTDRIVQIGAIKAHPDGTEEVKNVLINPTIPIPAGASAVHGIYDEQIKDKPTFRQIAKSFAAWLSGCDLAGYNSDNFDVPMLIEEFARCGIEFPEAETKFLDVLKIERLVNGHTLGSTYTRYTGEELDGAHDALVDIYATMKIFQKQLENNPELMSDGLQTMSDGLQTADLIGHLEALCQGEFERVDYAGKLYRDGETVCWKFGKYKGKPLLETRDYCNWVLNADFPSETKKQIRKVLENN